MSDTPLIGPYNPDDVLIWTQDGFRTASQFLSHVFFVAASLPDRPYVLNALDSRYDFLVGFAAAILRRQVTLLPQSRGPQTMRSIALGYPDSYCLTDPGQAVEGIDCIQFNPRIDGPSRPVDVPRVSESQVVAVAFTSGSTGRPTPNKKTWGALTAVAKATGLRLGVKPGDRLAVVATVPHQHMFGLEASVMLPLMHGLILHAGRPLFPGDIRQALSDVGAERLLVTTPLHIRACLQEKIRLPPLRLILSATAPLTKDIARAGERQFQTGIHEIYGFAEAGSVAERRTVRTDYWQTLDGVNVEECDSERRVRAWYLPAPVAFPDCITIAKTGRFLVHGRTADQVNVAGHRISLAELNRKLLEIEGVEDGAFVLPDDRPDRVTRLMAFVVAPGKTEAEIQAVLRTQLDPVFLPRPLVLLPRLPRNETGKLPREALLELVASIPDSYD